MEEITLPLRARHFIDTNYIETCNCAVSKAAKEFFNLKEDDYISEGVEHLHIGSNRNNYITYKHAAYTFEMFNSHQYQAKYANDGDTIILYLILTQI